MRETCAAVVVSEEQGEVEKFRKWELDKESLAIFDLLRKPALGQTEIQQIKAVAHDLLEKLKAEKLRIDQWRDKEASRAAVSTAIHDFLYHSATGLPENSYSEDDVKIKTDDVFRHVFQVYPTLPSPYYEPVAGA